MSISKYLAVTVIYIIFSVTVIHCNKHKPCLRIACAASVYPIFEDFNQTYSDSIGYCVHIVTGSSGLLYQQISHGAPYDIFFSADQLYPLKLYENKYTFGPPVLYALGKLIKVESIYSNKRPSLIGIADPSIAPYGKAAEKYLKKANNYKNIIYARNISQANQLLLKGAVEEILTSSTSTDLFMSDTFNISTLDDEPSNVIEHTYVILKPTKHPLLIGQYLNLLQSRGKTTFEKFHLNYTSKVNR